MTHFSLTNVPPQTWNRLSIKDTCQGHSPKEDRCPPTTKDWMDTPQLSKIHREQKKTLMKNKVFKNYSKICLQISRCDYQVALPTISFKLKKKKNTPHPAMMLPHDTLPWTDIHNAIKYEGTRPTRNGQATENLYMGCSPGASTLEG